MGVATVAKVYLQAKPNCAVKSKWSGYWSITYIQLLLQICVHICQLVLSILSILSILFQYWSVLQKGSEGKSSKIMQRAQLGYKYA